VSAFAFVICWVLLSVFVGMMVGYFWGRTTLSDHMMRQRDSTLNGLVMLLQSTEQLSSDVNTHNTELQHVGRTVGELKLTGGMEDVQKILQRQITAVIESNQRLEDDLVCARYRLEEQAEELDRTRHEARTDRLSGVANRNAFDMTLNYWLSSFNKNTDEPFSLLLMDVDHFKWINDTHGHPAGDRVVTQLGEVLRSCVRGEDYVARYGGDEFVVLFPKIGDHAAAVADRIRQQIAHRNFNIGSRSEHVAVTFSMGLTIVREGDAPVTIIKRADEALYQSKKRGRNRLQVYETDVQAREEEAARGVDDDCGHLQQPEVMA